MEPGTIVKFAAPENDEEAKLRMLVLEDNGDRVLVESLTGLNINPTGTFLKSDLEVEA